MEVDPVCEVEELFEEVLEHAVQVILAKFAPRLHLTGDGVQIIDNLADKEKAIKEGVDYFIGKPFSKETVNIIMENLTH